MRFSASQRRIGAVTLAMLWIFASGCARYKRAPTLPTDDPAYKPGGVSRSGLDSDPPVPLVLLPGDTLTIRTVSNESFEYGGLVVDSEGKIHVPTAGPIAVSGLAPQVAEKRVEEELRRSDRFLRASLLVTEWGGHSATVIGAVTEEGSRPVLPGMRVAELIAAAGGPLRTNLETGETSFLADLDGARLMRQGNALPISLRLALDGDPRHNVLVHPGDQLFVPAGLGLRVAVLGNTGQGGIMITHRPGLRLTEALASAGGITLDADDNDIRVIRGPLADPIVYKWSLQQLVEDERGDIELAAGDVVFVSEHWVAQMGEVINRISPLLTVLTTSLNTYLAIRTLQNQNKQLDQLNRINGGLTSGGGARQGVSRGMSGMTMKQLK